MSTVTLQPVDEHLLPRLLELAVDDTDPHEVIPGESEAHGWTAERRAAFDELHRPEGGAAYAVLADDRLVGGARITPAEAPRAVEAYVWLARSARGKGYSTHAFCLLIDEARAHGAHAIVAETQISNTPAVCMLRSLGAMLWEDPGTGSAHATLRVGESG
ncbi:GNAT family N-acetyltransferase [Actinoallomurus soli]|uniref:GNAT family N-acetyltransferase n=1 Tax=Actinoallomurus soli TaxID=2952535 RepID=UPI0020934FC1|nr:GNAT family N-acetyltransferase [Actinoallomurus soli]MCO5974203.1 GNAT family N-acetyltransferase [Actinoallomurus soli]